MTTRITAVSLVVSLAILAIAATFFDPRFQAIGSAGSFALSKPGLADAQAKIYRPYFDDVNWWGDLQSYNVAADGTISTTLNWSAGALLDARDPDTRRLFTSQPDGTAVLFSTLGDLAASQQADLGSQAMLDFLRGSTANEGITYRDRVSVMGDVINSSPRYLEYDEANLASNDVIVGANDGIVHVFNASTGVEEYGYIPRELIGNLPLLSDSTYNDSHRYFADGKITASRILLDDDATRLVVVGGLGGGGQAFYALNVTDPDVTMDSDLLDKFLWEVSDDTSADFADLGYSFSRPLIVKVRDGVGTQWAAIFGNGYGSTVADSAVGSGSAVLYIVDLETGALIRKIDTGFGDADSPNGLSSPSVEDVNADGVADLVYAGDLDGNVWRFDLYDSVASNWDVAFSGDPFFTAINGQDELQAITAPPRVLRHPDGGLQVIVGTGRMLSAADADTTVASVSSIYGLHDRLDGSTPDINDLVIQDLNEGLYGSIGIRTSSNEPVDSATDGGWLVDLIAGERILTELVVRSGRIMFSSTNPTIVGGEIWVNEIDYLSGGAPNSIIFDMNGDGDTDSDDNIDGNGDGDDVDPEDRVTGLYQGGGIVVSSPTLGIISANSGTFFINRLAASSAPEAVFNDLGVVDGHFDVDTSSFIAEIDNGATDDHVHEYDDKYDVTGVDYFTFNDDGLHEICEDVADGQRFKVLVVNADRSTGGRIVINQTYNELDPSSYTAVTSYDDTALASLPIYTLDGIDGTTHMTEFSMYFDRNAIISQGLIPTQTGCVKSNILSFDGEWRNGALTTWAVAVDEDGNDDFELTYHDDDPSKVVGITSGLLYESTLFWHWKGPCTHEYEDLSDPEDPDDPDSPSIWDIYLAESIEANAVTLGDKDKEEKTDKKKKSKDEDSVEDPPADEEGGDTPVAEVPPVLETYSPLGNLSNPNRVSWSEVRK